MGYKTKIIAASFRKPVHLFNCIKAGADYATVPPKIMEDVFYNKKAVADFNKFYEEY